MWCLCLQDSELVHLCTSLTSLTHLYMGRLNLPAAAAAGAGMPQPQPPPAVAAVAAADDEPLPAPLFDAPLAEGVNVGNENAEGGGIPEEAQQAPGVALQGPGENYGVNVAAGVDAAIPPAQGEVLLDDLGAIVDSLIQNMQGVDMPEHLQRVIERFEMIMQLDLTRQLPGGTWSGPSGSDYAITPAGGDDQAGDGGPCGLASLELSLQKIADLDKLATLQQVYQKIVVSE